MFAPLIPKKITASPSANGSSQKPYLSTNTTSTLELSPKRTRSEPGDLRSDKNKTVQWAPSPHSELSEQNEINSRSCLTQSAYFLAPPVIGGVVGFASSLLCHFFCGCSLIELIPCFRCPTSTWEYAGYTSLTCALCSTPCGYFYCMDPPVISEPEER